MSKTALVSGIVISVLAAGACTSVQAADSGSTLDYANSPHSYFAILPGYFFASKGHDATRNGVTVSGIFGYQFAPQWEAEINAFFTNIRTHHTGDSSDFYQDGLSLDLAYNLFGTDRTGFTPYVIAGVGGVYDDVYPKHYSSVNFQGDAGLGFVTGPLFTKGLFSGLKIRAEARYLYDRFSSQTQTGMSDARASVGIEIPLGMPTPPPPPPPPVQVVPTPPPPPPPKVVEKQCPIPFPGAKLDKNGCVIAPQTVILNGVHFAFNKATLRPDAETLLDQVAKAMEEQSGMTVQIAGYTDSIGSAAYNLKLSKKRADSVRDYLVRKGVEGSRMTTIGYGKSHPLVSPEVTRKDRALNRRVEFHILTK